MPHALNESRELQLLAAVREARAIFFRNIVSAGIQHQEARSKELAAEDIGLLRSDNTIQIAEFYYLVEEYRLADAKKIRMFLERHNRDMRALLEDKEALRRQSLSPQRIQEAIFHELQIDKVADNIVKNQIHLDQSDLARLLAPVISAETCRKTVVALGNTGLLTRRRLGQVLIIVSNGSLEKYYREHLTYVLRQLQGEAT